MSNNLHPSTLLIMALIIFLIGRSCAPETEKSTTFRLILDIPKKEAPAADPDRITPDAPLAYTPEEITASEVYNTLTNGAK